MLNQINLMGRLVRDPEVRAVGNGTNAANFTLAVERDYAKDGQKETDFIDCVAFRQTADFISKYFTKGRMMVVAGRLQIRSWTGKEGNKRKSFEVIVNSAYFGDSKRDSAPAASAAPKTGYDYGYASQPEAEYNHPAMPPEDNYAILTDDDSQLPF